MENGNLNLSQIRPNDNPDQKTDGGTSTPSGSSCPLQGPSINALQITNHDEAVQSLTALADYFRRYAPNVRKGQALEYAILNKQQCEALLPILKGHRMLSR